MNKAYKVIWSKVKGCYVVVSELAKERGKNNSRGKQALLAGIVMGTLLGGAFLPAGTVFAANDIHYVAVGVDTSKAIEARDNQGGSGTPSPVDPTANYDFPQTSTINLSVSARKQVHGRTALLLWVSKPRREENIRPLSGQVPAPIRKVISLSVGKRTQAGTNRIKSRSVQNLPL